MSYKMRKFLAAMVLLIGLPIYIVVAVTLAGMFERLPLIVELGLYIMLGVAWALPLRALFRGIGRPDPDAPDNTRG
ncbi:MAG: DUF2842 domain-containing protein [Paracoccaceae bacterium]